MHYSLPEQPGRRTSWNCRWGKAIKKTWGRRKNMKKSRLCLLLALAFILVSATALAARKLPIKIPIPERGDLIITPDPCANSCSTVTVSHTPPTCTSDGVEECQCKNCGEKYTASIPSSGHKWEHTHTNRDDVECVAGGILLHHNLTEYC